MHQLVPALLRPLLSFAILAACAMPTCQAGQASALFTVTMELRSPAPGASCRSLSGTLLECRRLVFIASQRVARSDPVLYRAGTLEREAGGAGDAVAASRLVSWGGRDYLEMTLTW
jgi:hypothetical protein